MSDSVTIEDSKGETFAEVIDVIGVSEVKKAFQQSVKEGSLHKWFKGSKSKDGKPGWVNVVTGGTCASDEPGEGTPKCVSSSKRASMTKAERLSASRRKKKADPGQQAKSGAAKPTYVSTDKKKKMNEEIKRDEYGDPIGGPKISKKQKAKNLAAKTPDEQHNTRMGESIEITEADKKGKGSGTKDACYHKVKARYSVWPSAYASGALVKCRKKGAANWGNKSESVEMKNYLDKKAKKLEKQRSAQPDRYKNNPAFDSTSPNSKDPAVARSRAEEYIPEEGYDIARDRGMVRPSKDKKDATSYPPSKEMMKTRKVNKGPSAYERVKKKYAGQMMDISVKKTRKEEYSDWREELECIDEVVSKGIQAGLTVTAKQIAKRGAKRAAKRAAIKVAGKSGGKAAKKATAVAAREGKKAAAETAAAVGQGAAKGLKKRKEKFVAKVKRKSEEMVSGEGKKKPQNVGEGVVEKQIGKIQKGAIDTAQKSGQAFGKEMVKAGGKVAAIGAGAYVGSKLIGKGIDRVLPNKKKKKKTVKEQAAPDKRKERQNRQSFNKAVADTVKGGVIVGGALAAKAIHDRNKTVKEGAAWTKKSGKNPSGGLNEKGRKSYERENPGSDLKAPSKKKGNKRRASFCARMKGMKKKLTSAKTARDPDSRINKSLRAWNC